jgi:hypothetical protein
MAPVRGLGRLHLGDARGRGRAHRWRRGQVFGTQIPHALFEPDAVRGLVLPMILAPLVALPVSALGVRDDDLARLVTARARAVFLPMIARAADRLQTLAACACEEPVIEHDLERADFLPWLSSRARLRPSTRPRTTRKAGSCRSRPSSYRRVPLPPSRPRSPYEISGDRSSGHRSPGSEWPVTPPLSEYVSIASRRNVAMPM